MNSPTQSDSWIGRSVGDRQRYRIEMPLGSGGMGNVFLAMDTVLGNQVALKVLKDTLVAEEELKKRFEREVAVCAALKSDHIVQISDYGVSPQGYPFYVMEYLHGQNLGQLLRREQQLEVLRAAKIISQVCQGLQLAHEGVRLWRDGATTAEHVKVIHRDLKPDNIFLVPTAIGDLVKILDFGIAKVYNDTAENTAFTSMFVGTFHYASPEQLALETHIDGRADIYSLGIILYEMLSGTDPFGLGFSRLNSKKISGTDWAFAHCSKQPLTLHSQPNCEHISPEIEAVVMRCLQKAPGDRFATVKELSQELQAAIDISYGSTSNPELTEIAKDTQVSAPVVQQSTNNTHLGKLKTKYPTGKRRRGGGRRRKFPWLSGIGLAATMSAAVAAYTYLKPQPHHNTTLSEIKSLQATAKYGECINKGRTVSQNSSIYVKAQEIINQCRLKQAQNLAAKNKLTDALATVSAIPNNSPLYSQSQVLSQQWANRVINSAKAQYQSGNLTSAIAFMKAIPASHPTHEKAQANLEQWQNDWQDAETHFSAAQNAITEGRWQEAIDESNQVPNILFWKNKTKPVIQKALFQIAKAEAEAKANNAPSPPVGSAVTKSPVIKSSGRRHRASSVASPSPSFEPPATSNVEPALEQSPQVEPSPEQKDAKPWFLDPETSPSPVEKDAKPWFVEPDADSSPVTEKEPQPNHTNSDAKPTAPTDEGESQPANSNEGF